MGLKVLSYSKQVRESMYNIALKARVENRESAKLPKIVPNKLSVKSV